MLAVAAIVAVTLGCSRERDEGLFDATAIVAPTDAVMAATTLGMSAVTPPNARADADMFGHADADTPSKSDAGREAPPESAPDPSNKSRPPLTSTDLEERAAHLVDALVQNDPALADDFFFPRAPFIPLKDVADPGRYFDQLLATYHRDIRSLRAERKDWTGASFVSFELGTTPTWVAPGKEYNKIGYFRTFGGKLRYRVGEKVKELAVSTIISWNGRWYVTHLSPIRH